MVDERGVGHTQGATVVDGRWYLTTSAGRYRLGSVWSGTPGDLRRHRLAVPVGVEDLCYWRSTDELWSLSEYPGRRYVFAIVQNGYPVPYWTARAAQDRFVTVLARRQ